MNATEVLQGSSLARLTRQYLKESKALFPGNEDWKSYCDKIRLGMGGDKIIYYDENRLREELSKITWTRREGHHSKDPDQGLGENSTPRYYLPNSHETRGDASVEYESAESSGCCVQQGSGDGRPSLTFGARKNIHHHQPQNTWKNQSPGFGIFLTFPLISA